MPENVYARRLHGAALGLTVAAALAVASVRLLIDAHPVPRILTLIIAAVIIACVFMKVIIRVEDEHVELTVLFSSVTIPVKDITGVSVGPETGLMQGMGPRFVGDSLAYIVTGPTVKIETRATSYLASAERPDEVVADIESRMHL